MDIQQKDKESLAAYIHTFKREAKRCNFTSNAATIRIFVKGLKNAHTMAAHVYEKGPQTLANTFGEVEKLQAAQQLTATLLPSSTVNVMSNEEDQYFQCQELGHITCHCPNVHGFECDEYAHIVTDCPDRLPSSGMPTHHHRLNSRMRHCIRSTSRQHHRDRHRHSRSRSQSKPHRYRSHSNHDSHRGHSRSHNRHSWCHHRSTSHCHHSNHHLCHDTPHQRPSLHRCSLTHSRDSSTSRPHTTYKPKKKTLFNSSSSSGRTAVKPWGGKHHRITIDDPQTDYYSSDDTSSDPKDDEGNLN